MKVLVNISRATVSKKERKLIVRSYRQPWQTTTTMVSVDLHFGYYCKPSCNNCIVIIRNHTYNLFNFFSSIWLWWICINTTIARLHCDSNYECYNIEVLFYCLWVWSARSKKVPFTISAKKQGCQWLVYKLEDRMFFVVLVDLSILTLVSSFF